MPIYTVNPESSHFPDWDHLGKSEFGMAARNCPAVVEETNGETRNSRRARKIPLQKIIWCMPGRVDAWCVVRPRLNSTSSTNHTTLDIF